MFESFTDNAIKVMMLAQEEARDAMSVSVDRQHILLGLICEFNGIAAKILDRRKVDLAAVRASLQEGAADNREHQPDVNPETRQELPITDAAQQVLARAQNEAAKLKHDQVWTGHILLGLLSDSDGIALQILHEHSMTVDNVREEVSSMIGSCVFNDDVQHAIRDAKLASFESGQTHMGSEKLLLAITKYGAAASVLRDIGITPDAIATEGEKIVGQGITPTVGTLLKLGDVKHAMQILKAKAIGNPTAKAGVVDVPLTPRTEHLLNITLKAAAKAEQTRVGTEHLLLLMLADKEGVGYRILENLSVNMDDLSARLQAKL